MHGLNTGRVTSYMFFIPDNIYIYAAPTAPEVAPEAPDRLPPEVWNTNPLPGGDRISAITKMMCGEGL